MTIGDRLLRVQSECERLERYASQGKPVAKGITSYAHSDCRIPIRGTEEPGLDQYQMNIAAINALAVDAGGVIRKEADP